jgi:hypothetical protein
MDEVPKVRGVAGNNGLAAHAGPSATRECTVEPGEPSLQSDPEKSPALHEGHRAVVCALVDETLDAARQTDIGFHLLDRNFGTLIKLHADDLKLASPHEHRYD